MPNQYYCLCEESIEKLKGFNCSLGISCVYVWEYLGILKILLFHKVIDNVLVELSSWWFYSYFHSLLHPLLYNWCMLCWNQRQTISFMYWNKLEDCLVPFLLSCGLVVFFRVENHLVRIWISSWLFNSYSFYNSFKWIWPHALPPWSLLIDTISGRDIL